MNNNTNNNENNFNVQQPTNNINTSTIQNVPNQPMGQPINNLSNNYHNGANNKKSKSKLCIMILLLVAVLGVIAFLYFKKDKKQNNDFDINYSTSFFIKDANGKYALFNDDGKKLTDFIFTSVSEFANGTARVEKDDAYGIINTNGKMTVDFGKYSYINDEGGMYVVEGEDYNYFLINSEGKVLYNEEGMGLLDFSGRDIYLILKDTKNKVYKVLNYEGKEMASFSIDSNAKAPSTNDEDGYISVFYNNKNYILNSVTGKEVTSFDADLHYCINYVKEDGKIIIMNSCSIWGQSQTYYKFIKDGKLYDLTDKCERVDYLEGNFSCKKNYTTFLLDSNLNVGIDISNSAYIDNNTYATEKDWKSESVDFYNNGSIVKNVGCRELSSTGHMKNGLYILKAYYRNTCGDDSDTYEYYKTNGEKAFGKSFKSAKMFDENDLAIVSEDKENYYLMDINGKKISQDYSDIHSRSSYYTVVKNKLEGIIDKNGNVILECKYKEVQPIKNIEKYVILTTTDSKYIVYDIEKKSEIVTVDKSPSLTAHYIEVSKDGKNQYYTYNGKMFYES